MLVSFPDTNIIIYCLGQGYAKQDIGLTFIIKEIGYFGSGIERIRQHYDRYDYLQERRLAMTQSNEFLQRVPNDETDNYATPSKLSFDNLPKHIYT